MVCVENGTYGRFVANTCKIFQRISFIDHARVITLLLVFQLVDFL